MIKQYLLVGTACLGSAVGALHGLSHGWLALEEKALSAYRSSRLYKYVKLIETEGAQPEKTRKDYILEASTRYSVPVAIIKGLMKHESLESSEALSLKGAIGLMQVMPFNAKHCGLRPSELWDERKNILCGTQILSEELQRYNQNLELALKAYNGGPKCVKHTCPESETHAIKTAKNIAQLVIEG